MSQSEIKIFCRDSGKLEVEKVYGDGVTRFLYTTILGNLLANILPMRLISYFYGFLQSTSFSKRKIDNFIEDFSIKMSEYQSDYDDGGYKSFNSFFERKFVDGARPFVKSENLAAFSEARYLGFSSLDRSETIPVKGYNLRCYDLVNSKKWGDVFVNGPVLVARLAPIDYHRFHFPDDGVILDHYLIPGELQSVNPLALMSKKDILIKNKREVTILDTKNFGKVAYVEVGAVCVGKIVQTFHNESFKRGDEKGHFLFGGSTVVVIGEKGRWIPTDDILKNSLNGIETVIKLGEAVGISVSETSEE